MNGVRPCIFFKPFFSNHFLKLPPLEKEKLRLLMGQCFRYTGGVEDNLHKSI